MKKNFYYEKGKGGFIDSSKEFQLHQENVLKKTQNVNMKNYDDHYSGIVGPILLILLIATIILAIVDTYIIDIVPNQ